MKLALPVTLLFGLGSAIALPAAEQGHSLTKRDWVCPNVCDIYYCRRISSSSLGAVLVPCLTAVKGCVDATGTGEFPAPDPAYEVGRDIVNGREWVCPAPSGYCKIQWCKMPELDGKYPLEKCYQDNGCSVVTN
ncbi:hypothetical protein BJ508DRAFT_114542 [Ascobolus immersus RN42]|uniref:Uncharacterized protein n=1 Tax=Ascobolus immersus RN42 TaxID=1160509 RepID=A0A3N4I5Q7_ASCIM|nr:hypothetical protein BJ508DRAFT_114542 [Ascobolus immersus RN42]